ncbi:lactate/malate family dehydrogenase, partial [Staphylococcus epidermidis]
MKDFLKIKKFPKKLLLLPHPSLPSTYPFPMVTQGIPDEFLIIHIPKHKLQPDLKHLNHPPLYTSSPLTLKPPQYEHSKHPHLLLITPPPPQKPPETPLQLLHKNTKIIKSILTT